MKDQSAIWQTLGMADSMPHAALTYGWTYTEINNWNDTR